MKRNHNEGGFTYLALLFFVATMGVLLAVTGMTWSTAQQRVKERELIFIGNQFRTAIGSFYERTPGTAKRYPASLEALLKDDRFAGTVRHLRRIYVDPITLSRDWGLIRAADGGIIGVHSRSADVPIKTSGFSAVNRDLEGARSYMAWRFVYVPRDGAPATRSQRGVQ